MLVIGKQSWGSKEHCQGRTLANLRRVSSRLEISSRISNDDQTLSVSFIKGRRSGTATTNRNRRSCGTTVTVSGFLWNLKIRRRVFNELQTLARIKKSLTSFALLHTQVRFSLYKDWNGRRITVLSTERGRDEMEVFQKMFPSHQSSSLHRINWNVNSESVSGFVSKTCFTDTSLQFICVNGVPIFNAETTKHVNTAVRKFIKHEFDEIIEKNAVFVLMMRIPSVERLQQVVHRCFSGDDSPTDSLITSYKSEETLLEGISCIPEDEISQSVNEAKKENQPCKSSDGTGMLTNQNQELSPVDQSESSLSMESSEQCTSTVTETPHNCTLSVDDWQNPYFAISQTPELFPVSRMVKSSGVQLNRDLLNDVRVLGQVECKYIVSVSVTRSLILIWDQVNTIL